MRRPSVSRCAPCTQVATTWWPTTASDWAITSSWWGKTLSSPPVWTSMCSPRVARDMAEHSMCQPGGPAPPGGAPLAQPARPGPLPQGEVGVVALARVDLLLTVAGPQPVQGVARQPAVARERLDREVHRPLDLVGVAALQQLGEREST